ncbi:hypothetical protein NC651_011668 [Populus alba x Populus x berolinensis]|nr:hypothetical protein NC651_011668 [Populus alba x Populus x berolinensis]
MEESRGKEIITDIKGHMESEPRTSKSQSSQQQWESEPQWGETLLEMQPCVQQMPEQMSQLSPQFIS